MTPQTSPLKVYMNPQFHSLFHPSTLLILTFKYLFSVFSSGGSSCSQDNSPDDSLASRSLRNDLLVAADSVTNAMSSLVRELNSGKHMIFFQLI